MAKSSRQALLIILVAALGACERQHHAPVPELESRALRRLQSRDRVEMKKGIADAESMPRLSAAIIDQLISELGEPRYGHLLINDTLVTDETPVTRVLVRHPESGESLRQALKESRSPQVRRFSAYVLGELRYRPALPELRTAIVASVEAYAPEEERGTEADPRALLNAAVDAHTKIDPRGLMELLLPFTADLSPSTRQFACESLTRVIRADTAPALLTVADMQSGACARRWNEWWAQSKIRRDADIFRWSSAKR